MYCTCTVSSSNAVYHISGAGIHPDRAAPQYDDRPIANNGLILSRSDGDISVNFISNSSVVGVGVVTLLDGGTRSSGENGGGWRVFSPFDRPGLLRIDRFSGNNFSPLTSTHQGIYTATIPDSNNNMFTFNVGLYPSDFDGELLLPNHL